jgi:hypothetical protein
VLPSEEELRAEIEREAHRIKMITQLKKEHDGN